MTTTIKLFPVMDGPSIPWAMIEPHEAQAKKNHDQSIQELAERGGLDTYEACCVLEGRNLYRNADIPLPATKGSGEFYRQRLRRHIKKDTSTELARLRDRVSELLKKVRTLEVSELGLELLRFDLRAVMGLSQSHVEMSTLLNVLAQRTVMLDEWTGEPDRVDRIDELTGALRNIFSVAEHGLNSPESRLSSVRNLCREMHVIKENNHESELQKS
jgi:hypothetical protein